MIRTSVPTYRLLLLIVQRIAQLALIGLTITIIFLMTFIHQIPYLNIYAREVIFVLVFTDLLLILLFFRISYTHIVYACTLLFCTMWLLQFLNYMQEAEYIGNIIYIVLCVGCLKEFWLNRSYETKK